MLYVALLSKPPYLFPPCSGVEYSKGVVVYKGCGVSTELSAVHDLPLGYVLLQLHLTIGTIDAGLLRMSPVAVGAGVVGVGLVVEQPMC